MDITSELLDTWQINQRINLYLLENLPEGGLAAKAAKSKSVGGHFAHIHSVRLMWLKASAPGLMEGLDKLEEGGDAASIGEALSASGEAIGKLLLQGVEAGKIKNFKPHPTAFLGYLIAHESFHRSQIELVLRQAGTPLTDKVGFGLWEWGTR